MKKSLYAAIACLLFVFQFITNNEVQAQIMEIGPRVGYSYYMGDINPKKLFNQSQLSYGVTYRVTPNPRWAFNFSYSNFNLQAADSVVKHNFYRNLGFQAKVNDFSAVVEFNFLEYFTGSHYTYFTPYIFAGFSFFTFDAIALTPDSTRAEVHLSEIHTEGVVYKNHSFSIPFGVGFKYSFNKRFGMSLEWRMQKTFTDYLDDVSGVYPQKHALYTVTRGQNFYVNDFTDPSGLGYSPDMQRGDPENKDWIGYVSLSLTYKFHFPVASNCSIFQRRYQ